MHAKVKMKDGIFIVEDVIMDKQKCERCGCEEYIPTHQYVKFEEQLHYLCQTCWDLFKGWYIHGNRAKDTYADTNAG